MMTKLEGVNKRSADDRGQISHFCVKPEKVARIVQEVEQAVAKHEQKAAHRPAETVVRVLSFFLAPASFIIPVSKPSVRSRGTRRSARGHKARNRRSPQSVSSASRQTSRRRSRRLEKRSGPIVAIAGRIKG